MSNVEAVKRYQEKRDSIMLRPSKEDGQTIRAAAAAAGQSVQAFVLRAVRAQMERERAGAVSIFPDNKDTPSAVVGVSPTQDKESLPAEHHKEEDLPS